MFDIHNPVLLAQLDYTLIGQNKNPYAVVSERHARQAYDNEFERLRQNDVEREQEVVAI
jgi:hypothetical protein